MMVICKITNIRLLADTCFIYASFCTQTLIEFHRWRTLSNLFWINNGNYDSRYKRVQTSANNWNFGKMFLEMKVNDRMTSTLRRQLTLPLLSLIIEKKVKFTVNKQITKILQSQFCVNIVSQLIPIAPKVLCT